MASSPKRKRRNAMKILEDKLDEAYTFLHLAIHEKSGDEREGILLDGLLSLKEAIDLLEKEKCNE
jgi:hypothetical protein